MGWLPPSLTASRCASLFLVQATNGKDGNHEYRYDDWCGSGKVCFPGSRGVDERRDSVSTQAVAAGVSHAHGPASSRRGRNGGVRSEEHTSEIQSLMRISYAVFCLQKTKIKDR